MKNKIKFIPVLMFVIFLGACSYSYELKIVNHSSQPLTITYKIKEGGRFDELKILSLEDRDTGKAAQPMPAPSFMTNERKRERIVTLAPNHILLLEEGIWEPEREGGMTDVIEIKLSGASGEVIYSGDKFYKNFEQGNSTVYTIEYK